jgi:hypothetical protein
MYREGDIIQFNAADRSRYAGLPEWATIESVPGIFQELTERQQEALEDKQDADSLDVMDVPEHERRHRIAAAHRTLHDTGFLKEHLGILAPEEIAASIPIEETLSTLPGIDLTHLHQE